MGSLISVGDALLQMKTSHYLNVITARSRWTAVTFFVLAFLLLISPISASDTPSGEFHGAIETPHPSWFKESFLDFREDIAEAGADGNINPRYVEVNFNQACNFKCSYCSPHLSNAWEKEIKQHGAYDIVGGEHNNLDSLRNAGLMPLKLSQAENPYVTAFWQWWPEMYKTLEGFRMTGGEPLMDSNTFKVLDYVYDNPNAWLEMSVTTNMCPPKPVLMDKFIESLQKLEKIQI